MGSRYMLYWRVYVYSNSLYSLPDSYSHSLRNWTPLTFRRQPDELHRLLNFANRDLSVLTCSNQTDVLKVFDILLELLLEVNMKSVEFSATLAAYLGPRTNHFVHELINFARSPYNDLISYECNVQYRARQPETMAGAGGEDKQLPLLPGLHCFKDFTMRVDEDECVDFFVDLDLEDDDADMIDEPSNLVELNAPLMFELRRMLNERQAIQSAQQMQQQQQSQSNQSASAVGGGAGAAGGATAASSLNGTSASTGGAMGLPPGVLSNDIGLDVAIERSILESIDSGYFTQRRNTSFARQIANRNRDAAVAAAAAAAAVAASAGASAAGGGGGGAAAASTGGGTAGAGGGAGGGVAQAANNASMRGNMTGRQRTNNVAVKRRRTVIREI